MRDYQMVSPSLEGVLNHESIAYENIRRPIELLRILDGPATKGRESYLGEIADKPAKQRSEEDQIVIKNYLNDLYSVFIKRLSLLFAESEIRTDEPVKLMAMLQEIIKVKKIIQ
jgi:hypothetical protein